ncbi:Endopolyphosphatase [Eremomyces bilateralis CBS 781.70]|uniref:Endopolyphosphatase n=1 Tax=Eremomyces bilateralis CBS 781.70 TaxID=1392243 RepID=A0A6G1GFX7_9PEZI|nr:Endopolyphosphatase [Eremomyces bilateralis CBS 781.70]KAF1816997.1 Endopolyphosphatase [Eremomyces bilateralis CBS 781.70]
MSRSPSTARPLKGRFLHITDIHFDPHYKVGSDIGRDETCHHGSGHAGFYGTPKSSCDTPENLINATFAWIQEHLRDEVDFVVWTGDSARHDNDEKFPRHQKQIVAQNEFVVEKFREAFGKPEDWDDNDSTNDFLVPIVPTFGNNDVLPHNILLEGPNFWTERYLKIWKQFIPGEQRHQFQRGGWYYVEVIPDKLAVFSLNTLYFFESNSAVDGCALPTEPGYEHFEWLRIQLQFLRERGMKAIITGHVPPARTEGKMSWEETCWQKYALWMRQYRDVIVGSMYGHMNIDHFIVQDFGDLRKDTKKGKMKLQGGTGSHISTEDTRGLVEISSASSYLVELRDLWARLPPPSKLGKRAVEWHEEKYEDNDGLLDLKDDHFADSYSVSLVSPSIIPKYFPTLRIIEYNISGLEGASSAPISPMRRPPNDLQNPIQNSNPRLTSPIDSTAHESFKDYLNQTDFAIAMKKEKKKHRKHKKKSKRYKFTIPHGPSSAAVPGPAYSPQPLTLLGYTQYFANLTHISNEQDHGSSIVPEEHDSTVGPASSKPKPKKFDFHVEYSTLDDSVFKLRDMTVRSYIGLAHRIGRKTQASSTDGDAIESSIQPEGNKKRKGKKGGKKKQNVTWLTFARRAFVGTSDPEELENLCGSD